MTDKLIVSSLATNKGYEPRRIRALAWIILDGKGGIQERG